MTTFSSQDFQQVYGKFPNTTAAAPASAYNTTWIKPVSGFFADADVYSNKKVPLNMTLGSVTFGPGYQTLPHTATWPSHSPNTVPYEPVVTLTPAQQKYQETQRQKVLEDLKKPTTAIRYDAGKADWSLMPWEAVEEINKVLEFGAQKYAAHNWQQGEGFKYTRVLNSMLRHVFAYMRGEDCDPESGLSHMAHAGCNVLFILYYIKNKSRYKNDDRYVQ